MSPLERFIARHKPLRYAFVLISFPIMAVRDELEQLRDWRPATDLGDLRRALVWAKQGTWAKPAPRPAPAPIHPKWQNPTDSDTHRGEPT